MQNAELYLEYEKYLDATGLAISTVKTYKNHVRHLYSYAKFYNKQLIDLGITDLIHYKQQLTNVYSSNTINNKLSAIRNFYNYLIQSNKTSKNPVFDALFITVNKVRPQFLSIENRQKLISYLQEKGDHVQLAFNIMMYAGLRLGEVTQIKIADIEDREGKVYIHVQDYKTNKLRLCPVFDKKTALDIKAWMKNKKAGERLFELAPRTLQYYAKQFSEKYEIKFSVHTCRHIFATDRVREGIRIELLKTLMGHKSINTTLLYIYISEDEIYSLI